ncbi:MAG: SDR family oxidoreductase [Gammaproteobacteria bacterium]|jgi:NAD(P)-dependent dehydrogenase (short-subunit alcohol dehydrogenase family)|nr:SDR family oxidoreductase [Pseudomonadales bacterium]MBT5718389.1 SDR family oxidoreductase [Gammaproteobacteria bacterium]MDB3908387.1 SDR family oxidoreductase [Gammaproteobacteria bacterium]
MTSNTLAGKNVVIIGGTAGIGLAAAQAAAAAGAKVWAAGRSEGHIETAKQISNGGFEVRQADTHDAASLEAIFKEVGTIDHLVSAAVGGERTLKPFLEQTEDQFKAAYDKLWGYAKVVRTGAPYLAEDGAITLVSGSPARKIKPAQSPLSCVGASVENLVRCLAVEMAPVRVNVVSPGTVDTAMFDFMGDEKQEKLQAMTSTHLIKRAGTSEEVAQGILFVMQNSFVTGTTIDVDGGRILS